MTEKPLSETNSFSSSSTFCYPLFFRAQAGQCGTRLENTFLINAEDSLAARIMVEQLRPNKDVAVSAASAREIWSLLEHENLGGFLVQYGSLSGQPVYENLMSRNKTSINCLRAFFILAGGETPSAPFVLPEEILHPSAGRPSEAKASLASGPKNGL